MAVPKLDSKVLFEAWAYSFRHLVLMANVAASESMHMVEEDEDNKS